MHHLNLHIRLGQNLHPFRSHASPKPHSTQIERPRQMFTRHRAEGSGKRPRGQSGMPRLFVHWQQANLTYSPHGQQLQLRLQETLGSRHKINLPRCLLSGRRNCWCWWRTTPTPRRPPTSPRATERARQRHKEMHRTRVDGRVVALLAFGRRREGERSFSRASALHAPIPHSKR